MERAIWSPKSPPEESQCNEDSERCTATLAVAVRWSKGGPGVSGDLYTILDRERISK